MHSNIGYLFTLSLNLSILIPLAKNPKVDNYTILLTNVYWVRLFYQVDSGALTYNRPSRPSRGYGGVRFFGSLTRQTKSAHM